MRGWSVVQLFAQQLMQTDQTRQLAEISLSQGYATRKGEAEAACVEAKKKPGRQGGGRTPKKSIHFYT